MRNMDAGRTGPVSHPRLRLVLLLAGAVLIPTSVGQARPLPSVRPLFQVSPSQWQGAMTRWTAYPAGSWTVEGGALTNRLTGVKFCGEEYGHKSCSWTSLVAAPYHIPTTRYALDVVVRIQGSHGESDVGTILLSPNTSAGPVLWLTMGDNGIHGSCPSNPPMLVGHDPNYMAVCGFPISAVHGPRSFAPPMDNGWHHYRLQVRGKHYRLFIDGQLKEVLNDPRPAAARGVVPGFYASGPTKVPSGTTYNRIWVQSITITALPTSAH